MISNNISVYAWSQSCDDNKFTQHTLFNSDVMAQACKLERHEPFSLELNGHRYLAYKRHASAIIGSLSLQDMAMLLKNLPLVRQVLLPLGIHAISVNSWNAENNPEVLADTINMKVCTRFEFIVDSNKYSRNKISSNHKRNIKKSIKVNAKLILPVDEGSMHKHIAMVNENLSEKGQSGITNSAEYFHFLIKEGAGLLLQVKDDEQIVASTFFIINNDYAYYHSSGTNAHGKEIGAAHFLVDSMVVEMRERHIDYLNLGGCTTEQAGLQRFKLGFRPETRVLLSAQRIIFKTIKSKLRSILTTRPRDILCFAKVGVYLKEKELFLGSSENYSMKKMDFDTLFIEACQNQEISRSLAILCRPSPNCYALYNENKKILAISFIETPDQNKCTAVSIHDVPVGTAELTHVYVVKQARNKGVGRALIGMLEQEILRMGYDTAYVRVSAENTPSQQMFNALGYRFMGYEKIISTGLMGGKSFVIRQPQIHSMDQSGTI